MRLLEVTLHPRGLFGTPLRGDILFGHMAAQIALTPHLIRGGIEGLSERYITSPDFIVSSPLYPVGGDGQSSSILLSPLPPPFLIERGSPPEGLRAEGCFLEIHEDLVARPHHEFERLTGGPETHIRKHSNGREEIVFAYPSAVSVFILFNPSHLGQDSIVYALERVGLHGYGRGSSYGQGAFTVGDVRPRELPPLSDARWVLTLAPTVPAPDEAKRTFFRPLIHQGYHSAMHQEATPKKLPIKLAHEGAAISLGSFTTQITQGFCGRGITGFSSAHGGKAIHQGYAPVLPLTISHSIADLITRMAA